MDFLSVAIIWLTRNLVNLILIRVAAMLIDLIANNNYRGVTEVRLIA